MTDANIVILEKGEMLTCHLRIGSNRKEHMFSITDKLSSSITKPSMLDLLHLGHGTIGNCNYLPLAYICKWLQARNFAMLESTSGCHFYIHHDIIPFFVITLFGWYFFYLILCCNKTNLMNIYTFDVHSWPPTKYSCQWKLWKQVLDLNEHALNWMYKLLPYFISRYMQQFKYTNIPVQFALIEEDPLVVITDKQLDRHALFFQNKCVNTDASSTLWHFVKILWAVMEKPLRLISWFLSVFRLGP